MLLLAAGGYLAADTPITLHGRVVDENGLPVGAAQVKLEKSGGHIFSRGRRTIPALSALPNLSPGEYTCEITKPGYFILEDRKSSWRRRGTDFRSR